MQLGVKDAAGIFDVSEKTIFRWIRDRHLPARQVNEQYRFNRAELLEWAAECRVGLAAGMLNEPHPAAGPQLRLTEALQRGGDCRHIGATNKSAVLGAAVALLPLPREVDRGFLHDILLARESLGSTAIGDSIAIPHVRHPIVLHGVLPTISLCFLDHPVDFGAADGLPVRVLFLLLSPTVRAHHLLLARLAFALKDPRFRAVLDRQGCLAEVLEEARRVEADLSPDDNGLHN